MGIGTRIGLACAAAGVALAIDVARYERGRRRVTDGGTVTNTLTGEVMSHRHLFALGARNLLHPARLTTALRVQSDARAAEKLLFHRTSLGYDDASDAFRHTYAAALLTARLSTTGGMSVDAAAAFTRAAGRAHEDDSMLHGRHHDTSRAMDLHNNETGVAVARALLAAHLPVDDRSIALASIDAIATGRAVVLSSPDAMPRPATADDLARAGWRGLSPPPVRIPGAR